MKLKLNFKSLLILFLLTCVSTVTISTALNAAPVLDMERAYDECSGNGGTLTQITGTTDCEVTPDVQKITFYSLHMCQSKPTAPTPSATQLMHIFICIYIYRERERDRDIDIYI